jgi:Ca2+-binding RTX toxin-like protein
LRINIAVSGETLTVDDFFRSNDHVVEYIQLDDGSLIDLREAARHLKENPDSDTLLGTAGNDTLDGGVGDDIISGGEGEDSYVLNIGTGDDLIVDEGFLDTAEQDTVVFGAGINPFDVAFRRINGGGDLLIEIGGILRSAFTVQDQFSSSTPVIEAFTFEDGTRLTWEDVQDELLRSSITNGDDIITGYRGSDVIDARAGDDVIFATRGEDYIQGGLGRDKVVFGSRQSFYTVENLVDRVVVTLNQDPTSVTTLFGVEEIEFAPATSGGAPAIVEFVPNQAPSAADGAFTVGEDQTLLLQAEDLAMLGSDPDSANISLVSVAPVSGGTVSLLDGVVTFTPDAGFHGDAQFAYTVSDGGGLTAAGLITVSVSSVNDAPVAFAALVDQVFNEDEAFSFSVDPAAFADADGDMLTFAALLADGGALPAWLTFDSQTLQFSGTPPQDFNGDLVIEVSASDTEFSISDAFTLVISPTNDAPTVIAPIADQTIATNELFEFSIAGAFDDLDGDALQYAASLVDGSPLPDWLSLIAFNGFAGFVGIAPAGGAGAISVRVTASDSSSNVSDEFVLSVISPNLPPVANDDSGFAVDEDGSLTISAASVLANDSDADGDEISLVLVTAQSGATVAIDANGDIVYTPAANFSGADRFEYRITDGVNGDSVAFVDILVNEINDAPVATDDSAATTIDAPLVIRISDLLANDGDIEDPVTALSIASVTNVSAGAATIVGGEFIVVEAPLGFTGTLTFNYTLADADGGADVGLVTASVTAPAASTITGTAQRDLLLGSPGDETIIGLAGADTIEGRGGDDTIIGGAGADNINGGAGFDVVDYSASNTGLRADLNARMGIGGDAHGDLYAAVEGVIGTNFADELFGDAGANLLAGGLGADTISGAAGADTLDGGGDSDDYEFTAGFGADVLREAADATATDRIVFASSIAAADIFIATDAGNPNNLVITHSPSGSKITVENHFAGGGAGVEQIVFSDGTIWDRSTIDSTAAFARDPNQTITGTTGDDTLTGGTGHDTLKGAAGSDDYLLVARHGNDFIKDVGTSTDIDRVFLDASIAPTDLELIRASGNFGDLLLVNKVTGETIEIDRHFTTTDAEGVEQVIFGDGTIWDRAYLAANAETQGTSGDDAIFGTNDNERIRGGLGDDTMNGKNGNDDYLIAAGDGDDVVDEFGLAGDVDRIVFDASVLPADIRILKSSADFDDLFLVNSATGETITVDQHFLGTTHGVEQFAFADGTFWDRNYIVANALMLGTGAGELLRGNADAERIRGGAGDDSLLGNGGSDDYLFGADDGADLVDEFGASTDVDRIIFDAGVNPTDILLTRGAGALATTVYVTNVVTGSVITIDQQRSSSDLGVEEIRFADGTVWDRAAVEALSANGVPVVLDLDGDGVELVSTGSRGVRFDFDGDGRKERGGWVAPEDGILALDRNGDGRITGVNEISFLGDREGALSDLEGLGAFDSDGNGILSSDDDAFSSFVVWRDRNGDGVSQREELKSLSDLGIVSLAPVGAGLLNDGPVSLTDNSVLRSGSVGWANGETTDLADVALRYEDEAQSREIRVRHRDFFNTRDFWFPGDHDRGREPFSPKLFDRFEDSSHVTIADFGERQANENGDHAPIRKMIADFSDDQAVAEAEHVPIHKTIVDLRGAVARNEVNTGARDQETLLKMIVERDGAGGDDANHAWRDFVSREVIDWPSFAN